MNKIILASKSKVRKEILNSNNIDCEVVPSNVDEDSVKISLSRKNATPEIISKNLAELKANKVSAKFDNKLVIGVIVVIAVAVLGYFVMQQAGTDRSADSGTGGELMRTNQTEGPVEIGSKTVEIELLDEFATYGQSFN